MSIETSLTESEVIEEVRNALAGLDTSKIPDDTIIQAKDRFIVPLLNQLVSEPVNQDHFDNAVVAWTAEASFNAWMAFTRLRDREVEAYVDPGQYQQQLESRTDSSLYILDAQRPPDIPNQVVTIKHDGEHRKVYLDKNWIPEDE